MSTYLINAVLFKVYMDSTIVRVRCPASTAIGVSGVFMVCCPPCHGQRKDSGEPHEPLSPVRLMRRRLRQKIRQIIDVARYARRASATYGVGAVSLYAHTAGICSEHGFTGAEAYRLGLFDPSIRPADLIYYCSRKRLTKIQRALNPPSLAPLLRNKAIFYRFCQSQAIPVPALYALAFAPARGWTHTGRIPDGAEQWIAFIERELPAEFVIKPVDAAFGQGVLLLRRKNDRFADPNGQELPASSLWEHLGADCYRDGFLIQQRIYNHPQLVELTGVKYLQTVRLITAVDTDQKAHVIHAACKLIGGSNVADNFDEGTTGNLQARVDLLDGRLLAPITAPPNAPGHVTLQRHPGTGRLIEGFSLPSWDQACTLVRQAAVQFLPIRAIGWDVALTPDGAVILEGNIWWNPPNQHRNLHTILQALRDFCPAPA